MVPGQNWGDVVAGALWRVVGAVLAVAGTGVPAAPVFGADATAVMDCGSVVTGDTTLANDLIDCAGVGLVVGADHVDLDLNGHRVDGNGSADVEGIQVVGRHDVTITDGTVTDFVEGVAVLGSHGIRVRDLTLSDHRHVGVFIDRSRKVTVERTRLSRIAFSGIFGTRSTRLRIEHNRVRNSGGGVGLRHTTASRIAHNRSVRTECGGLLLYDGSRDNLVDANVVVRDGCEGISLHGRSDRNLIRGNHVRSSDAGVGIDQSRHNVVVGNTLLDNRFVGVYAFGASGNRVDRNRLVGNGEGSEGGVHVLGDDSGSPSRGNAVTANRVVDSVGDGIWVEAGSRGTRLAGNIVTGSTQDGIQVDERRVAVSRNVTVRNQGLGIRAVLGVTDGGGNRARANGGAVQCLHVECTWPSPRAR
jgi:parallel beta-helix repeat protein